MMKDFFRDQFEHPNYSYFFISLVLLLVLPVLIPITSWAHVVLEVIYGIVILLGCVYTSVNYKDLIFLIVIGIPLYLSFLYVPISPTNSIIHPALALIFFGLIFTRLIGYVLRSKEINNNDLLALCSGYLLIGIIAASFFYVLDLKYDDSFQMIQSGDQFYNLLYYSFITLTSVGYGDILPTHNLTKALSMMLGIAGQLYLAIIVGLVIGKYLAGKHLDGA